MNGRIAGIIKNDFSAGKGVCLTVFVQGCPIHCSDCHNQELWDFAGGREINDDTLTEIAQALTANNIQRSLCIMGGEPLCENNAYATIQLIKEIKSKCPTIQTTYVWSGYTYETLKRAEWFQELTELVDYLIDGPYIAA